MDDQKEHWAETAKLGALAAVIDPNDTRGHKNRYIARLRDAVILKTLPDRAIELLDFGCGSGNLSRSLASDRRRITGIDISAELLELARQQNDTPYSRFVLYDGGTLPFAEQTFDIAVTYVVLNHITDDDQLIRTMREVRRVLTNAGSLICIEQTRRQTTITENGIKKQRSVADFERIFNAAGFTVGRVTPLRKARFALIYLVRYGLIPAALFGFTARIDRFFAKWFPAPANSYVDSLFVMTKDAS
jgi:ubiquinone/menaquinone biosynthesis C-methylase UbiE